ALSGICLYTVPNLVETTSVIRMLMLLTAGSVGTYGIVLVTAFILYYLFSSESYGSPLLAPFSPMVKRDLKDGLLKYNMRQLPQRPLLLRGENKTRLKDEK
ncbi:MAG: spore germination protein, partial [Clostridia bacterium]|nr:spore germination protein [Clostridia bacterium]